MKAATGDAELKVLDPVTTLAVSGGVQEVLDERVGAQSGRGMAVAYSQRLEEANFGQRSADVKPKDWGVPLLERRVHRGVWSGRELNKTFARRSWAEDCETEVEPEGLNED